MDQTVTTSARRLLGVSMLGIGLVFASCQSAPSVVGQQSQSPHVALTSRESVVLQMNGASDEAPDVSAPAVNDASDASQADEDVDATPAAQDGDLDSLQDSQSGEDTDTATSADQDGASDSSGADAAAPDAVTPEAPAPADTSAQDASAEPTAPVPTAAAQTSPDVADSAAAPSPTAAPTLDPTSIAQTVDMAALQDAINKLQQVNSFPLAPGSGPSLSPNGSPVPAPSAPPGR